MTTFQYATIALIVTCGISLFNSLYNGRWFTFFEFMVIYLLLANLIETTIVKHKIK